ncbi:hypothetical protein ACA910_000544 [Epithemia clementina (nom. ined.)]
MMKMMKKNNRVGISLLFVGAFFLQGTVLGDEGDSVCDSIVCQHGSGCVKDSTEFESHRLPDGSLLDIHSGINDFHCACETGWTGTQCDVAFESCDGSTHKCYHGGNCVLGLIDKYENDQLYCNCDDAWEGETRYAGKYCELKSIDMCDPDDNTRFCLNEGSCNTEYPAVGKSCICPDGYKGPHCEYEDDDVPDCTLSCQNGGHCILGTPSESDLDQFSGFWNIEEAANQLMQFCRCQQGWYGQHCEIPSQPCGEDMCFHGAKCTESSVNGQIMHHCDCRFSNQGSFSYAGRFCQYEATVYCDKGQGSNVNGHLFCVNNGTCQEDSYLGCVCPDGYRGFSCEYFVAEDLTLEMVGNATKAFDPLEDTTCTLTCNGRGTCRDGIKDVETETYGSAEHLSSLTALASEQYEHCVCQSGWTGLNCEYEVTECAGGTQNCFHGGQCYTGGDEQKCDCSTANSSQLGTDNFAGDMCQHPATDICTETGSVVQYDPAKGLSFCVNYGTCVKKVAAGEPHPGCNCDKTKWTGPHCEVKVAQAPAPVPVPAPVPAPIPSSADALTSNSDGKSGKTPFEIAMIIVIIFVLIPFIFFTLRQCYRDRRKYVRENVDPYARRLRENSQDGYHDETHDNLNLAPRRASSMMNHDETRHLTSSSRDPFASQLVIAAPLTHNPYFGGFDSGPQVDLGPPKDEDGNVLHSVEIL